MSHNLDLTFLMIRFSVNILAKILQIVYISKDIYDMRKTLDCAVIGNVIATIWLRWYPSGLSM